MTDDPSLDRLRHGSTPPPARTEPPDPAVAEPALDTTGGADPAVAEDTPQGATEQEAAQPADEDADQESEQESQQESQQESDEKKKSGSFLRELPILIAVALVLALLIKAFLVQAFYIPSGSMQETLDEGDRVLVNKLIYRFRDIHRGEIVVFNGEDTSFQPEVSNPPPSNPVARALRSFASALGAAPPGEKDFIKRVIGVGGDRVACCDAEGRVTVNDIPLEEQYVFPGNSPSDTEFSVQVPEGYIWVMGDHRAASQDSRAYIDQPGGGFIPTRKVIGRAFVKVWPVSHIGGLGVPETFDQKALNGQGWSGGTPLDPALGLTAIALLPAAVRRRRLGGQPFHGWTVPSR